MSKYSAKPNKVRVARFATPSQVISANPVTERYSGLFTAREVLDCRHNELKSWRVLGYELAEPHATLSAIVKRGRVPSDKLIKKLNNTYGCHIVVLKPVSVSPLPCGHAELVKRCPICQPRSTTPNATRKRSKRLEAMRAGLQLARTLDSMTG